MHTIWRFIRSLFDATGIVLLFGAWGLIAALASNSPEIFWVAALFAAIFFAPVAFSNRWDDMGDA